MVVFLCCRAATIAASMAVLGPGGDRPAAVRPEAKRRTAVDGFFVFREECRAFAAGEKNRPKPLREGDRGFSRPSGLIRPFEVA